MGIYIADYSNFRVRKVNTSGIITTYAGSATLGDSGDGGPATLAGLVGPIGVTVDNSGNLYISQFADGIVRQVINTVSVQAINSPVQDIYIYPNPSNGDFTINVSSAINEQAHIIITDIVGQKVKDIYTNTNIPLNVKLDEQAGLYFINITTIRGAGNAKLIITQ